MDYLQKARELGEIIAASDEFKNLKAAEEAHNSSPEVQAMVIAYNQKSQELASGISRENPSKEELENYQKTLQDELAKLRKNKIIDDFLNAKAAFDEMMKDINNIIGSYINPDTGCGGDCEGGCSGCSGCH